MVLVYYGRILLIDETIIFQYHSKAMANFSSWIFYGSPRVISSVNILCALFLFLLIIHSQLFTLRSFCTRGCFFMGFRIRLSRNLLLCCFCFFGVSCEEAVTFVSFILPTLGHRSSFFHWLWGWGISSKDEYYFNQPAPIYHPIYWDFK